MRRTLKLFVIPAGKPAGAPPEPGPTSSLEADGAGTGDGGRAKIELRSLTSRMSALTLRMRPYES